jgi:pyruvate,water dikinase
MRLLGGLREVPFFYFVRVMETYRSVLLAQVRASVARGEPAQADDIFFVPLPELKRYAQGEQVDLKSLAARNRQEYRRECARRQMPRLLLSTGEAFYEGLTEATAGEHDLVGEAVSAGVVEGPARVVLDPHGVRLEPGEILVCPATDPGWTPLFLTASGLVMEVGGLITHGSIIAREYGLPAVVGVHDATRRLKTGQRVRVDGNLGRVTVL